MRAQPVNFDVMSLLEDAWREVWEEPGLMIGGFILFSLLSSAAGGSGIGIIIQGPLFAGIYVMYLKKARGQSTEIKDLFYGFEHFVPTMLIGLVTTIFLFVGMMCLIIPGLILWLLYLPVYLVFLDTKDEFWTCMEESRQMVWENFGQWFLLAFALFLVNLIAGIFTCGLGCLITGPISMMAITLAYVQSVGDAGSPPPIPDSYEP
ncbi:MAG: hypothetical protein HYV27_18835 [Candidatus Hydrogenedentes bacterium]|nr:hypothetical protein [Candidatus Hydrogenedentota bacterium]